MKIGLFFTAAFLVASAAGALIGLLAFLLYLRHWCAQCCRCLPGSSSRHEGLRRQHSSKNKRRGQEPISTDATSLDMQAFLVQDAHFGGLPSDSNASQESEDYDSVLGVRDETLSIANTEDSHRYSSLHFTPWRRGNSGELTPLAILMAVPESIRRTLNFSGSMKNSSTNS